MPFKSTAEQDLGIKTPQECVEDLRKLAKNAHNQTAAEQERIVEKLAIDYRSESDAWVRREILRALAAFPQRGAGAVLVTALADEDVLTRRTACVGLGIRGDAIAVQELSRVLASDTNVDVRLAAARALGASGADAALGPLSEAMADGDPAMQAQVHDSLVAISDRDYGTNVQAWRDLAQTGHSDAAEASFAEKLRRTFY